MRPAFCDAGLQCPQAEKADVMRKGRLLLLDRWEFREVNGCGYTANQQILSSNPPLPKLSKNSSCHGADRTGACSLPSILDDRIEPGDCAGDTWVRMVAADEIK